MRPGSHAAHTERWDMGVGDQWNQKLAKGNLKLPNKGTFGSVFGADTPCYRLQNSTFLQILPPFGFSGGFYSPKAVAKEVSFARSFATLGKGVVFQSQKSLEC